MSALLTGSAWLEGSGISTSVATQPLTLGAWAQYIDLPGVGALVAHMALTDASGVSEVLFIGTANLGGGPAFILYDNNAFAFPGGGILAQTGRWYFMLGRAVSSAERYCYLLDSTDNSVSSGSDTTDTTVTNHSTDTISIGSFVGASSTIGGYVAEAWWANADIAGAGSDITADQVRQIAYGGPFSIPHLVPNIQEYHSLRSGILSGGTVGQGIGEDYYGGQTGPLALGDLGGGAQVGQHPPLPYWYRRPNQIKRPFLTI